DREGNLWIDTLSGGGLRYKDGQFHPITPDEGLPEGAVTAWCEAPDGALLVASLSYAGLLQWRGNKFVQGMNIEALPQSSILSMTFDRERALWMGTREAGLWRLKDGRLTSFRTSGTGRTGGAPTLGAPLLGTSTGLPDDKVNSLYEDRNGEL